MKVPLLDIKKQIKPLRKEILSSIKDVVDSGQYILGKKVLELEEKMSSYCGTKRAIGVSSGTDALLVSLMSLDIKPGDVVITTPYSFFATAGVIARLSAIPVFVDIDPISYNIDPDELKETLTNCKSGKVSEKRFDISKVKAIIPVHLYGQCANMEKIMKMSSDFNIPVIEDAAQAIGSEYLENNKVRKSGSFGLTGCFSFFPSKNLGCMGDGGIVTTSSDEVYDKILKLRVHGSKPKYFHKTVGGNFRLDPIQAAILLVKFPHLDKWHNLRQSNSDFYTNSFIEIFNGSENCPVFPKRVNKNPELKFDHIFNQYTIRVKNRDSLKLFLKENNIDTEIYYPLSLHLQECFDYLQYKPGDFPNSELVSKETLALPIFPELKESQQTFVVRKIYEFFKKNF